MGRYNLQHLYTVNDLFSAPALVTTPHCFIYLTTSIPLGGQLQYYSTVDRDSAHLRLVTKGF